MTMLSLLAVSKRIPVPEDFPTKQKTATDPLESVAVTTNSRLRQSAQRDPRCGNWLPWVFYRPVGPLALRHRFSPALPFFTLLGIN
jgi:hypothetical protein